MNKFIKLKGNTGVGKTRIIEDLLTIPGYVSLRVYAHAIDIIKDAINENQDSPTFIIDDVRAPKGLIKTINSMVDGCRFILVCIGK